MLSFFPLNVLDEIWDLIESVSEGFLTYSSSCMVRYEIYLAQIIIMTRKCVVCKNHVASSMVKLTLQHLNFGHQFCGAYSCPAHSFVLHGM